MPEIERGNCPPVALRFGAGDERRRADPAMAAFRADRFGQFIHWGLYSIPAGSWQGVEYASAAEFLPHSAGLSREQWARLLPQFTAEAFDARAWARAAKRLGARYLTVTAKHHDGFCLWPSAHTEFTVAATPLGAAGRDPLAEIVQAYADEGLAVHLYYSVLDWHHPDWRSELATEDDEAAFARYLDFATAQLRELATRYPSVRGFWFDGTWDDSVRRHGAWTWQTERMLKSLLPGAIVNSRLRADDLGARHIDSNGRLMGDYLSAYERRLPDGWDRSVAETDWEACMTIPQASWGFHAGARSQAGVKSPAEIIASIVQAASLGGNLLLNFGPTGDGSLPAFEQEIVGAVGAWLAVNGEAVYGCGPADGWRYPGWGFFTASCGAVYAVVTNPPTDRVLRIDLPDGVRVTSLTRLADASAHPFQQLDGRTLRVRLPAPDPTPLVLKLLVEDAPAGVTDPDAPLV